ncbi:MAG: tetratricopeptide repeat protein [Planctomycetota bacterium]
MKRSVSDNAVERLIERIRRLYRANNFDARSVASVSVAARKHRRAPEVLLAIAEYRELACVHKRIYSSARHERAYRRVLELDPANARAWENLAAVLDIAGRYAEAARAAQKALRFGDDPDAVAILSRIRAQQGKKSEARRLANTIRRARSDFARSTSKEVLKGLWDPF